eukprot:scaffold435_cov275-Chaetoceros_neogracile.AAC.71
MLGGWMRLDGWMDDWLHDWLAAVCLFEVQSDQGSSGESQMKIVKNQTFEYMKERRALVCRKCHWTRNK